MRKRSQRLVLYIGILLLLLASNALAETVDEPLVSIMLFDTDLREALSEIGAKEGHT